MNIREKFKRKVISLIHGLPYENARISDMGIDGYRYENARGTPITLSRVMIALQNWNDNFDFIYMDGEIMAVDNLGRGSSSTYIDMLNLGITDNIEWNPTNKLGATATDDDQCDETIEQLYKLIK